MLVHRVNYVIGVREIVAGEILWPVFVSQGAELDDTVLSDALKLWLCVVRVTKILALSLANRLRCSSLKRPVARDSCGRLGRERCKAKNDDSRAGTRVSIAIRQF